MQQVTSIGEILFDVYPDGKTLGGASFNFIYHVIKLTGEGSFVSRVGNDDEGNSVLEFLKKNKISTDFVQVDEKHPTGESIASLNDQKIPDWKIKTGTAYDFIELTDEVESLVTNKTDCLYFGTLAQRDLTTRKTIHHFFKRDLKYFCDLNIRQNFYTKELIKECVTECNVLKINIDELRLVNELLLGKALDTTETPKRLLNEFNLDLLCVTNGSKGATIFNRETNNHYYAKLENIVDTVGAGDAYAAILCVGYLKNWNIEKINKIASDFAGEIVKINGALPHDHMLYEEFRQIVNE